MGVFDWTFNTVKGVGAEMGGMIGIKGGEGWMREAFGVPNVGTGIKQFGGGGGLMGMVGRGKNFFGVGFNPTGSLHEMRPYLKTMSGMRGAYSRAGFGSIPRTLGTAHRGAVQIRELAGRAQGIFRNRQIAGGVAGAAGLAAMGGTVGLGNAAVLGVGVGLGVAGGRYLGRAGTRNVSTWGRRGGKLGFAAAGLGLMTGTF